VVSPWIMRNLAVSGTFFGTAGYAITEGTSSFTGTRLMQSVNPDLNSAHFIQPYLQKFIGNTRLILQGDLPRVGGGWVAIPFFAGLMLGLRNLAARRLRYFTMMCLGVFVIVQALGKTPGSSLSPELNSENLLVLLTPLAVIFAVAFFLTLLGQMNYARRLNGGSLELRARLAGQLASGLLYSGERFAVGGQDTVRGYRENLLLSDDGAVGSVELSCSLRLGAVPCSKAVEDWKSLRAGVFVDGAVVKNEAGAQPAPTSISSVGIDLTWAPTTAVLARVTYGHALRYAPPTGRPDLQDRGFSFEVTVHPLSLLRRR